MYRKIVLLAFIWMLLLLATSGTRIMVPVSASPAQVHPGQSIQEAINAATPGDTIFVHAGTYYEHIIVNQTVLLIGENRRTTIIDGNGTGTVINVAADNVNVTGFTIQNAPAPHRGILVGNCNGNIISNNIIRKNFYGLELYASNNNKIVDNTIIDNSYAMYVHGSSNSSIFGNTMAYNGIGVWIASSTIFNTFYHNNFISNTNQVNAGTGAYWDNGTEGNYWSDYKGVDKDGDGVGDPGDPGEWAHGLDKHPLIIPTRPFPVIWDDVIYPVALLGNSTVSGFYFSQPSKEIGFYVNGLLNKIGFCNVTIPKQLLRAEPLSAWAVSVDDQPPLSLNLTDNATHSFLYFTYNHSASRIRIIGTHVVPEFPTAIFLPLFIIVTLVVTVLRKRGKECHDSSSFKTKSYF